MPTGKRRELEKMYDCRAKQTNLLGPVAESWWGACTRGWSCFVWSNSAYTENELILGYIQQPWFSGDWHFSLLLAKWRYIIK